jgi:hypothetical protein
MDANRPAEELSSKTGVEPGTFGCHEALHLARTFMIVVEQHLAVHPAVRANPEWEALATTAVRALGDLYHAIRTANHAAQDPAPTRGDGPLL